MKYIEINKKFTEKVAKYLANGYIINTATMNGSQGEVSHVDLTNGTEILIDEIVEISGAMFCSLNDSFDGWGAASAMEAAPL